MQNYQLVALGFLVSVMNLCLKSVTPTLFLLLEARFGSSILQNYDGLLRNQLFKPRLSFSWRVVLVLMLAIPLGLSAAYKRFLGGESGLHIHAPAYTGNRSYYGIFSAPGLQSFGLQSGISPFFNATLPFAVATSSNGSEPTLPEHTQAYGNNVLLLSSESTAVLYIP